MRNLLLTVGCTLYLSTSFSQATDDLEKNLEDFKTNQQNLKNVMSQLRAVKVGLSASIRTGFPWEDDSRAVAFISPTDNAVAIDEFDRMSYIISTSVTYFPKPNLEKNRSAGNQLQAQVQNSNQNQKNNRETKIKKNRWVFGPTLNINLAELGEAAGNVFNKQVDGGIGVAFKPWDSDDVVMALTFERIATRRPTRFLMENIGNQLRNSNGDLITSIDANDDRYYINSGLNGVAFKVVINLTK